MTNLPLTVQKSNSEMWQTITVSPLKVTYFSEITLWRRRQTLWKPISEIIGIIHKVRSCDKFTIWNVDWAGWVDNAKQWQLPKVLKAPKGWEKRRWITRNVTFEKWSSR